MKKLEKQVEFYLNWCQNTKKLSSTTIKTRRNVLTNFARDVSAPRLTKLSNQMIEDWVRSGERTGSTINEYTTEIKTMLKFFLIHGEKLPKVSLSQLTRAKEIPKRRRCYSREQIAQVLSKCDELEWLLITLSFECGFRIHELAELKLDNLHGRQIAFLGKGRKLREVYVSQEAKRRLDYWIKTRQVICRLWIRRLSNDETAVLSKRYLDSRMRKAFRRAGFEDFHPHALRHSFATEICRNGAPIEVVKEMLGHSDIRTTMRYVHSLDGRLEEAFEKYRFS